MREFYYISLNHCNLITLHDHQSQFKRNKQCKKNHRAATELRRFIGNQIICGEKKTHETEVDK